MAKKNILELKYFLISFLILESLQILTFVVLDLLLFYIFFESVLPVLFIVIILYGSGEEKIRRNRKNIIHGQTVKQTNMELNHYAGWRNVSSYATTVNVPNTSKI